MNRIINGCEKMTTVKEILDQFNTLFRYTEKVESIDIGKYTFDEGHIDKTGYIMEFTNSENPDVWLKINDDNIAIVLIKKIDDETVEVTSWNRNGKFTKQFPANQYKPRPKDMQKPLPTKD